MRKVALIFLFIYPNLRARPIPSIDEKIYDFGIIKEGQKVSHEFVIRNEGDDTLRIKGVQTSCGCMSAGVEDTLVPPGGSTKIRVDFVSKSIPGNFDKAVWVRTNVIENPLITLRIKGYVEPLPSPIAKVTKTKVNVGEMKVGEERIVEVYVRNDGELPLSIEGIETQGSEVLPPFFADSIPPGDSVLLRFRISAREEGEIRDLVKIYTNDPRNAIKVLRILGFAKGRSNFQSPSK